MSLKIFFAVLYSIVPVAIIAFYFIKSRETKHLTFEGNIDNDHFIKLPDGWTHYELTGPSDAPLVVLIHGGSIPYQIWEPQMKPLLQNGYRVLRYDHFGKGLSQRVKKEYTRELYTNQLRDLLSALNITAPVNIVGPSFGGAIATSFSSLRPDLVNSIILISPVLNLNNSDSALIGPFRISKTPLLGRYIFHTYIMDKIIQRGVNFIKNDLCKEAFQKQFKYRGTEKSFISTIKSDAYDSYRDASAVVSKSIKHLLLIRGSKDPEVTVTMIEEVKSDMPQCPFLEIDGAGHSPNTENADTFNEIMLKFLKKCN